MSFPSIQRLTALVLLVGLFAAPAALGQVNLLWYKEVPKDGRIYVFNDPNEFKAWEGSGELGKSITKIGYGPNGETVVFDNEVALDLYNFKHGREPEVRPYEAPRPPKPVIPTKLKVGDGELKFGALVQAWYVHDDSEAATGTSQLRNTTGVNTFLLRRAEVKISGTITPAWGFEVMVDPAKTISPQNPGTDGRFLQDLAVSFLGLKGHELMIGQKKIYLTEEGVRSSATLDFAERAVVTRTISDRREAGVFWKGEWGEHVTTYVSATNGTATNVSDDSDDTLFFAGRVDVRPVPSLLVGLSGATSGGEGPSHLGRDRFGAHVRWEGTADLPLGLRAELYEIRDEQLASGVRSELKRNGWYGSALYTFAKKVQVGLRYEEFDRNEDVTGSKLKVLTAGVHYLIKGNNANLKLNVESITDEGRTVNGAPDESYVQGVLAAQVSF